MLNALPRWTISKHYTVCLFTMYVVIYCMHSAAYHTAVLFSFLVERDTNGSLFRTALCVQCDGKEQSFAASNVLSNM